MTPRTLCLEQLSSLTLQLITTCNISCDYCFQDADKVSSSAGCSPKQGVDPDESAETVIKLMEISRVKLGVVFSGGEPLLVPAQWYERFFQRMDRYLEASGKSTDYSIQTNVSILRPELLDLFKKHDVHFSIHYDGEVEDPKLLSKKRKANIMALHEEGFRVTGLVVGTVESLQALPGTIRFFSQNGVRFYRINYVSSQGRGHQVSSISPQLRAESEFESAFLASQFDFATRDNVVMNKFVFYYNHVICGADYSHLPRPQKCRAGIYSAYIDVDGYVYPCSFFTGLTGPIAKARELPVGLANADKAIAMCEAPNSYYDQKCKKCRALPICGEYCSLTPVTDKNCMDSFCHSQIALRELMDQNAGLTRLIARRFLAHKESYPGDRPRTCGTLSPE